MQFKTVSYLKLNLKLKIDLKMCTFKNLEEILKTWKKFGKNEWQHWSIHSSISYQTTTKKCIGSTYIQIVVNIQSTQT